MTGRVEELLLNTTAVCNIPYTVTRITQLQGLLYDYHHY